MIRAALFTLFVGSVPLSAQSHPLVGVWQVSFAGGMRIENGAPTPILRTGKLTVAIQGDSLIGTLVTDPMPDLPTRPPVRLATKAGPGNATFLQRSKVTINMNGNEQEATSVSTWILAATGDQLEGSVDRKIEGFDGPGGGAQPVTGKRVKN